MDWIVDEAVWLIGSAFVDALEDSQLSERFEALGEVVGVDEGVEVFAKLIV